MLAQATAVAGSRSCDLRIFAGADAPGQLQADEWLAWLTRVDVLASLPLEPGPGIEWCEIEPAVMNGAAIASVAESSRRARPSVLPAVAA